MKTWKKCWPFYFCCVLITGIACNAPISNDQQSDSTNADEATESADRNRSNNASGGTANAGSALSAGEVGNNAAGSNMASQITRFEGHKYAVLSKGDGTGRSLVVAATNLKGDTSKADSTNIPDVKGVLQQTAVADLDKDGNPEVYCFTRSEGTEATGNVYALTFVNGRAVQIQQADMDLVNKKGYRGRDSFYVKQPYLLRTYPVYGSDDVNAGPSGGKQTVKYALKKDNGSYMLKEAK